MAASNSERTVIRVDVTPPNRLYPDRPPTSTEVFRCYCVCRMKVLDFVQLGGLGGSPREQFDRSHRALRRSHHGSCPSRGSPYEFVAIPLLVVANSLALPFDGRLWLCVLACPTHCTNTRPCSTILTCATKTVPGCTVRCSIWPSVQGCIQDSYRGGCPLTRVMRTCALNPVFVVYPVLRLRNQVVSTIEENSYDQSPLPDQR